MTTFPTEDFIDGYFDKLIDYNQTLQPVPSESYVADKILSSGNEIITEYFMRGKDVDCGILTYRYWSSLNAPDPSAIQYSGTKCGASPLQDVIILSIKIKQ